MFTVPLPPIIAPASLGLLDATPVEQIPTLVTVSGSRSLKRKLFSSPEATEEATGASPEAMPQDISPLHVSPSSQHPLSQGHLSHQPATIHTSHHISSLHPTVFPPETPTATRTLPSSSTFVPHPSNHDHRLVCPMHANSHLQCPARGQDAAFCLKGRHPRICRRYLNYGLNPGGCSSTNCKLYHPEICSSPNENLSYLDSSCPHRHVPGTRRPRPQRCPNAETQQIYLDKNCRFTHPKGIQRPKPLVYPQSSNPSRNPLYLLILLALSMTPPLVLPAMRISSVKDYPLPDHLPHPFTPQSIPFDFLPTHQTWLSASSQVIP